jgi:GrpB-like predicted nucleotidyltransferase (UPF0157 family)
MDGPPRVAPELPLGPPSSGNVRGMPPDVPLVDVADVVAAAEAMVDAFGLVARRLLPDAEVHHIGATALPTGLTKGDVDVNIRIDTDGFTRAVDVLRRHYDPAQEHNWTPTYASFSPDSYPLPLGIQVTVIGSPDDFLLALRDAMLTTPAILDEYSECKRRAAPLGPDAYWDAKDTFLRTLRSTENE